MKQLSICVTTLCAVLALSMNGVALAETPDGETPANEGVCDELIGTTPGLYGLCVAYCEAQDLDKFGEQKTSNDTLLKVYNKRRNAGDPEMPCRQAPCPCWDAAELDSIVANLADCGTTSGGGVRTSFINDSFKNDATATGTFNEAGTYLSGTCSLRFSDTSRRFDVDEDQFFICFDEVSSVCSVLPPTK